METKSLYSGKRSIRIAVCIVGLMLLFIMYYVLYILTGMNETALLNETRFDSGWDVEYEGETYSDVNLSEFSLPTVVDKGHTVVLKNKVPDTTKYFMPVLVIETRNTAVATYSEDTCIYEYGVSNYNENKPVGSGYQYIHIGEEQYGTQLRIELTATELESFSRISTPVIMEYSDVYSHHLTRYRVPLVFGCFLLLLGAALIIIGLITGIYSHSLINYVWMGVLSLCVGTWTLCYYKILQLYAVPLSYCTFIEYLAIFVSVTAALLYFRNYVKELNNKVMSAIHMIILVSHVILTISVAILHLTNTVHIAEFLKYVRIMICITFIYVAVVIAIQIKRGNKANKMIAVGLVIFLASIVIDVLNDMFKNNYGYQFVGIKGLSAITASVFIMILFVIFAMDISKKLKSNVEKEVLYRMAYTDEMTQIYNRRYCEEKMDKLMEGDSDYGIYNFDLNDLKKTNDNLGHGVGDELIKGFASILKETFGKKCTVARMGGDEFVVIIEDIDHVNIKAYDEALSRNIKRANDKEDRFKYSMSFGYADSHEIEVKSNTNNKNISKDPRAVYALADNRMYEYKRRFKELYK